jgi:hypothetical protein
MSDDKIKKPKMTQMGFNLIVDSLLYPAKIPQKTLSIGGEVVALGLLGLLIILAIPCLKNVVYCVVFSPSISNKSADVIKNVCDFVSIISQVIIVIMIGGLVFTDGMSAWFRQKFETVRNRMQLITEALQPNADARMPQPDAAILDLQAQLQEYERRIAEIGSDVTFMNFVSKINEVNSLTNEINKLLFPKEKGINAVFDIFLYSPFRGVPFIKNNQSAKLLLLRYGLSFSGGIYGLVAYGFFLL